MRGHALCRARVHQAEEPALLIPHAKKQRLHTLRMHDKRPCIWALQEAQPSLSLHSRGVHALPQTPRLVRKTRGPAPS